MRVAIPEERVNLQIVIYALYFFDNRFEWWHLRFLQLIYNKLFMQGVITLFSLVFNYLSMAEFKFYLCFLFVCN